KSRFSDVLTDTVGHLGAIATTPTNLSLHRVDVAENAQNRYDQAMRDLDERNRQVQLTEQRRRRLRQHIRDNILHYCRAIWAAEDPQQRLLRYRRLDLKLSAGWQFVGSVGGTTGTWSIDAILSQLKSDGTAPAVLDGVVESV